MHSRKSELPNNEDGAFTPVATEHTNANHEIKSQEKTSTNVALCNIIGDSEKIRHALHCISIYGQFDAPVLITGETGTGKELAARGLHYGGERASKPFIAVNCATLTSELFSSELFGHKKGAFTDARQEKKGLISAAEGGTLFLDEIDSLSVQSQAALLRFLQEAEYRPVGSEKTFTANVRIVASANCNLETLIEEGLFRRDLYYRLYILSVHMPALRERKGDIEILTDFFLCKFSSQYNLGRKSASHGLLAQLCSLPWRGNVRELENLIHRLYLTCSEPVVDTNALHNCPEYTEQYPSAVLETEPTIEEQNWEEGQHWEEETATPIETVTNASKEYSFSRAKKIAIESFESKYVIKMLNLTGGNITHAATLCGKDRRAFGKLVKKYNSKVENNHDTHTTPIDIPKEKSYQL